MMATYIRQNGQRLTVSEAKYNHQLRQIQRRKDKNAQNAVMLGQLSYADYLAGKFPPNA